MTTYTIDDIRGPTMAREMAALKDFVLSRFNECLSDATTAAASAATAAANAVISSITGRVTALETADAQNVKLTGAQTVAGVKTFSSSPVVPTVATGTFDTKAANGTKVQNELDAYAAMVRTTGNQNIAGVKNNDGFFDYRIRLTGTNVYELFRTELNTDTQIYYVAFSRYGAGLGKLVITLDANGDVASMTTDKALSTGTNDGITTFYAYKDGTSLVVCAGNSSSSNNYIAITVKSVMSGAGTPRTVDVSNVGTSRAATTYSAKVLQ